jgi:hypothetical protein
MTCFDLKKLKIYLTNAIFESSPTGDFFSKKEIKDGKRKGKSGIGNVALLRTIWNYQVSHAKKLKDQVLRHRGRELWQILVQVLNNNGKEGDRKHSV